MKITNETTPKLSNKRKRKIKKSEVKNEADELSNENEVSRPSLVRSSDEPFAKKVKWCNKQRVLIISSRQISFRNRHLVNDLRTILPHSKPDNKIEKQANLEILNEVAKMKNCSKCLYFEEKKHTDLYLWMSNATQGPSIKYLVENVHTMSELKLTGNCLKGSRPLLCFDENFSEPHWTLMKELLQQVFGTPKGHPKSQPFVDHVFVFSIIDNKIWFRNYQIVEEDGQLTEIGPRFVLNPIKVFDGSFSGETIWSNPHFKTPTQFRRDKKKSEAHKYVDTVNQKVLRKSRTSNLNFKGDPTEEFFETKAPEEAKGAEKQIFRRKRK